MHPAMVVLNSSGEWEENRFLKDKLVEMNAVVTAECQLSYNGTTASYSLEYEQQEHLMNNMGVECPMVNAI